RLERSTSLNQTRPAVSGSNCVTRRPSVDLPQPDSPTRPRHSPRLTSKLTPSTALTDAPSRAGKCFTTSWARTSGDVVAGCGAGAGSANSGLRQPVHARPGAGPHVDEVCGAHLRVRPLHRHPAGRPLAAAERVQRRFLAEAPVDAERAAGVEPA